MATSQNSKAKLPTHVRCCIVGGGPAGVMAGVLLARSGVDVLILEKHKDFFRDFRGDTVHPSTLGILHELGLWDEFMKRPHQEIRELSAQFGSTRLKIADFSHLPEKTDFLGIMPQWDFLDMLSSFGKQFSKFQLRMEAEVVDLVQTGKRVSGVKVRVDGKIEEVLADLVIGADGRSSTARKSARLHIQNVGAPIDVLWLKLPREPSDPEQPLLTLFQGAVFVAIPRGTYYQCGVVVKKNDFEEIKKRGLPEFKSHIISVAPIMENRLDQLTSWDAVRLLTVTIDRLKTWARDGLVCIGDSAHAMSPVGGVGINLAIQDAVAAANILVPLFLKTKGEIKGDSIHLIQKRREFPTIATQKLQVFIQDHLIRQTLYKKEEIKVPLLFKLLARFHVLRRFPARLIGLGFRPEHIKTKNIYKAAK